MTIISNLFEINKLGRSRFQIILWWELRRIIFNIILLGIIFIGLKIIGLNFLEIELGNGDYFMFLILVGLALILNFLYTFGWISEILKKPSLTFAPKLFKSITLLSLILLIIIISAFYYTINK